MTRVTETSEEGGGMPTIVSAISHEGENTPLLVSITCMCGAFWGLRIKSGERVTTQCHKCKRVYRAVAQLQIWGDVWEIS